jgi:hypothetical protein
MLGSDGQVTHHAGACPPPSTGWLCSGCGARVVLHVGRAARWSKVRPERRCSWRRTGGSRRCDGCHEVRVSPPPPHTPILSRSAALTFDARAWGFEQPSPAPQAVLTDAYRRERPRPRRCPGIPTACQCASPLSLSSLRRTLVARTALTSSLRPPRCDAVSLCDPPPTPWVFGLQGKGCSPQQLLSPAAALPTNALAFKPPQCVCC